MRGSRQLIDFQRALCNFPPMRQAGYTKQERHFIHLMRLLTAFFFALAALLIIAPSGVAQYITQLGIVFFNWRVAGSSPAQELTWLVPSCALMLVLMSSCIAVLVSPLRNLGHACHIIVGLLALSVGYGLISLLSAPHFLYLVGSLLFGVLCIVVWMSYQSASQSRNDA